jgi:hypothetical protein
MACHRRFGGIASATQMLRVLITDVDDGFFMT